LNGGSAQSQAQANAIGIDSLGRIVAAGQYTDAGVSHFVSVRLNVNGTLDSTFDGNGKADIRFGSSHSEARALVFDPLDRIVLGGWVGTGNVRSFALAR
jgi:hypothetical protein